VFRWQKRKKKNHRAGDIAGCRMRSEHWTHEAYVIAARLKFGEFAPTE
jgi:hypothetical protein